jgi:DNA-binding Lrp family transcriptional regulator
MSWTFLTNHAHVLLCLAQDPEALLRDVAARVGLTERAVQRIIAELEEARYLVREREGRCNRYYIRADLPLRHPIECHRSVAALVALGEPEGPARRSKPTARTQRALPRRTASPRSRRSTPR